MALKLHEKRSSAVTRTTTAIWQDYLLKYSSRVVLDMTTIIEVKRGLEFGRLLKMPTDLTFNYPRMAEFIVAGKRPLSHVEWVHLCVYHSVIWKIAREIPCTGQIFQLYHVLLSVISEKQSFSKFCDVYFGFYGWFLEQKGGVYSLQHHYMYTLDPYSLYM